MFTHEHTQVIFQADPASSEGLKQLKDMLHSIGKQYMGRPVRVQTINGHVFDGTIVHIDSLHLYLQVSSHGPDDRGFYNPVASAILPLVLYELLVIVLLST